MLELYFPEIPSMKPRIISGIPSMKNDNASETSRIVSHVFCFALSVLNSGKRVTNEPIALTIMITLSVSIIISSIISPKKYLLKSITLKKFV